MKSKRVSVGCLRNMALSFVFVGLAAVAFAQSPTPHPNVVQNVEQGKNAEFIHLTNGTLRLQPCEGEIVRVTYVAGTAIPDLSNPALSDSVCAPSPFSVQDSKTEITVVDAGLKVLVNKNTASVRFIDAQGQTMLAESDWPFPRKINPTVTDGHPTTQASTWFALTPEERLYGLGQHQNGVLNQRNLQMELSQDNTNISVPFFISSKGYGLLWNSGSVTGWNNRFRQVLAISSNASDAVDYYYIAGPSFDKIIAGYRRLSGAAPLFPRWAYGYWQSKLAYSSTEQLVGVAAKYRALHIPLDNLVLDAGWETGFGSRQFTKQYPDPKAMVQRLHDQHVHLMVSIWPLFQPGNANYDSFASKELFVTPSPDALPAYLIGSRLYDAFSPEARSIYWQQAKKSLYDIGVDAFWLDSTEPADLYAEEHGSMLAAAKTAIGDGSKYANLFPLMTTAAIHDGQRGEPENKRVFILTRSGFTGMQRNSAAAWSGDTLTTFDTLRRQIPAGLNYALSGLPYWTTDIGGFVGGNTDKPAYRELFVRWFEYGAFCPIFRAHGARENNQNELWSFGPQAQQILTRYDRLRYRLMPYIYALAARTTFDGYTPMRALGFDFRDDNKALDVNDEFMFGPSLLVAPVTEEGATSREVYLPKGADWYDFWTGQRIAGGVTVHRDAPLSVIPLYVRAGSVLPMGPEEEYTGEHAGSPIELRIYPGADGETRLYDDDGLTYDYEKGNNVWQSIRWNDASRTLTIVKPQGNFSDATKHQAFHVTLVAPKHGIGEAPTSGDRQITSTGTTQTVHF